MKHLKIYEAFSTEDYQKALAHIKTLVSSNKSKEEILQYLNTLSIDVAKDLDELRKIIDRIYKFYMNRQIGFPFEKGPGKLIRKRKAGVGYTSGFSDYKEWKAGDVIHQRDIGYVRFIINSTQDKLRESQNFLENQKTQTQKLLEKIPNTTINIQRIKFIFDRIFEILDFCISTNEERIRINNSAISNELKFKQFDILNRDIDFENEVEELNKCYKIGKNLIKIAISQL